MKNNICLYGVIKTDPLPRRSSTLRDEPSGSDSNEQAGRPTSLSLPGIGRDPSLISHRNLVAVTDRVPLVDYKSLPKDRVAQDLVAHQQVLEEILKQTTVIPAKFGTFLEDEAEVEALLKNFYHKLEEVLGKFAGKIELDLVATWDGETIFKNLYREDQELRQLQAKVVSARDPKSEVDLKVQVGKKAAEALQRRKKKYLSLIIAGLKECSEDICHHELMDEMMILNSSFLLPREREKDFGERVGRVDKNLNSELKFRIVGPLPPYSFATLEVRKIADQELAQARELLGLGDGAGLGEIKRSFRQMAARFHPDHDPDRPDAEERFDKINKAHQLLSDYHELGGKANLVVKVLGLDPNPMG